MVNMRFTSDAQRKAVFAAISSGNSMFSSSPRSGMVVRNRFSEKRDEEFKEGLNGFVCPRCGDVMDEDSIGGHSCSETGVNSVEETVMSTATSPAPTIIEEHIIDDVDDDEEYEYEDEEDNLFG